MANNGQIKTKKRVSDHGEVFTAEREVNAMLDLVKQETERIDSRFLEPACGDGNFLAEILRRKLVAVKKKYGKSYSDYERYSVIAVSSIYGIDILADNVAACQIRMFDIWDKEYTAICKKNANDECRRAVNYILSRNILCGNALSLKRVNEKGEDLEDPIIFSEWSPFNGNKIKRRDFRFEELINEDKEQISIYTKNQEYDEKIAFIPKPVKEFKPIYYRKVFEDGE